MKRLTTLVLLATLLAGCTAFNVLTARLNPVEQDHYATIASYAKIGVEFCNKPEEIKSFLTIIRVEANTVLVYTEHANTVDKDPATMMVDMIDEMHRRYLQPTPPSIAYCKLKLANIEDASITIMKAIENLE